jgi:hypothetical protein
MASTDSLYFDRLFGPANHLRGSICNPSFVFLKSTVFLMLAILAGVVLTIAAASRVAGDAMGSNWRTLAGILVFMLLSMSGAAVVVIGVMHSLRRSGGAAYTAWKTCKGACVQRGRMAGRQTSPARALQAA